MEGWRHIINPALKEKGLKKLAWFKVDDGLHSSKKVMMIPRAQRLAAVGLWTIAGSWSAHQLTDGLIPDYMLKEWGATKKLVDALLQCGLWVTVQPSSDDQATVNAWSRAGQAFANWAEYQPTKEEVDAQREKNREKVRKWREGKKKVTEDVTGVQPGNTPVSNPSPDPTRPDPTHLTTTNVVVEAPEGAPAAAAELPIDTLPGTVGEPTQTAPATPKKFRAKPRRQIPKDFQLSEELKAWTQTELPNPEKPYGEIFMKFVNYYTENKIVRADWDLTWKNWIKRESEAGPGRAPAAQRFPTLIERQQAAAETMHAAVMAKAAQPKVTVETDWGVFEMTETEAAQHYANLEATPEPLELTT